MRPLPQSGRTTRRSLALLAGGVLFLSTGAAASTRSPAFPEGAALSEEKPAEGQPTVRLDRLTFPQDVVGAKQFESYLKKSLKREAYRADWGAGRENKIEYRFSVTELRYTVTDGTLRVHCSAVGRLPGGQTAKSQLSFGGHQGERVQLTQRVLEIVGRGVITRLAELERKRRGLK